MQQYDQIVIGGGIVGCSIAYHLAKKNGGRVVVLERNELASAASSRAAGLILQVTSKSANTPLAQTTIALISTLEEELEETLGFHNVGSLRVGSSSARKAELQSFIDEATIRSVPYQRLDCAQAKAMVPWLELPQESELVFMPTDGYVDPYLLSTAYARAARIHGVEFRLRTSVTGIIKQDQRVVGVDVGGERIFGDTVIDAAGAWAALVSSLAGYALPMAPVRSHYWICEPEVAFGGDHPITILPDAVAYTRPETGGLVLGIQEPKSKTFDARDLPSDLAAFSPTVGEEHWDILADGAEVVKRFFPAVMTARFSNYVAGLSAYTPDGSLLLGSVPGVSGFMIAAGCCGSGIALSGGIGAIMSDMVLGNTLTCDVRPFDPGRFGKVDPYGVEFRERCAAARAVKSR